MELEIKTIKGNNGRNSLPKMRYESPDGGWGWVVLLGTFITLFISSGLNQALWNLIDQHRPVARIICLYFSSRIVVLIAGVLGALGLILTFFATSVKTLYFTIGILIGSSAGLTIIPCILVICEYFKKRRGLASGVMLSGSSLGAVTFPPLVTFLLEEYSMRGALLILGGISLHVLVAGALLQPIKYHLIRVVDDTVDEPMPSNYMLNLKEANRHIMAASVTSLEPVKEMPESAENSEVPIDILIEVENSETPKIQIKSYPSIDKSENLEIIEKPEESKSKHSLLSTDIHHSIISIPFNASMPYNRNKILSKSSSLSSSFLHLSTLHFDPATMRDLDSEQSHSSTNSKSWSLFCCFQRKPTKKLNGQPIVDFTWLKDTLFIILSVANVCTYISWYGVLIFLPPHMDNKGFSSINIATVLSVIAFTDFVGRILFPCLYDFSCCHIKYWYMLGVSVAGIVVMFVTFVDTYEGFLISTSIFGFFTGCYSGLSTLIYVEMLGEKNVSSSYSLSLLIVGFFLFAMPPVVGWFREVSGSYQNCFFIFGIIQTIGAASLLFEPCAARRETRKEFEKLGVKFDSYEDEQAKKLNNGICYCSSSFVGSKISFGFVLYSHILFYIFPSQIPQIYNVVVFRTSC
ncbi:Monocarboxylate transporter 9 [Nymphon striatum]|nr:Monocarboxylate transporter 9 [Nymphon striatum]